MINVSNRKSILIKFLSGSVLFIFIFFIIIMIPVLSILNFFGDSISVSTTTTIDNNAEYADVYTLSLNKFLKYGYVPLARILYFYNENNLLTFDDLYQLNLDKDNMVMKNLEDVCKSESVKNMLVCDSGVIKDNKNKLELPTQLFNFPLTADYTVSSFFNKEREVFGKKQNHNGWDFRVPAQTPVYSVCSGVVKSVSFKYGANITNVNGGWGNYIRIECDDYAEKYIVTFAHLYPNSARVSVGQKVGHWTLLASVGTTGYSTGNHLHYQVNDSNGTLLDGMQFVNMSLINDH